ncbi:translation initiation factor IF-2-like [Tympanuchus pallidicinctus]|uniref:translation initiation factor IF-2-like n=1 Tax=Tympanuchus pallidicinctus TaxID=109042 RepID=UPI002286F6AE|nr:translation initiation factor IF-2-like [Tympanuchus pallidicinctus]
MTAAAAAPSDICRQIQPSKSIASTPAAAPAERTSRLSQLRPADPRPTAARITAGRPAPPARLTRRHRPQPGAARARGAPRGAPSRRFGPGPAQPCPRPNLPPPPDAPSPPRSVPAPRLALTLTPSAAAPLPGAAERSTAPCGASRGGAALPCPARFPYPRLMALPGAAPAFRGPRLQRRAGRQRRDERRRSCPAPPIRAPRWAGPAGAAAAPAGGAGRGAGPPRAGGGGAGRGLAGRRRGRAGGRGESARARVGDALPKFRSEGSDDTRNGSAKRERRMTDGGLIGIHCSAAHSETSAKNERPARRSASRGRAAPPVPPPRWEPHRVPPLLRKTEFSWGVSLGCQCGFCVYIFSSVITDCIIAWQQLLTAGILKGEVTELSAPSKVW